MRKFTFLFLLTTFTISAQKISGEIKDTDKYSKTVIKMNETYANNDHSVWDEMLSDDAKVYLNNTVVDGKTVKEAFKGHHSIFNDIKIIEAYAHTNYFKSGDVWTNNWFIWMGTGNKTGIRFSNRAHFDMKWDNGKIIEMLCYFDNTALNMEITAQ
tara:strand:+ start:449 stop:916 length:468 start_codon:yes stop_codon:yes gene_type:complete